MLPKVYIYGYLNRIQSSRRLECAQRNRELRRLVERLTPDLKTIANGLRGGIEVWEDDENRDRGIGTICYAIASWLGRISAPAEFLA